MNRDTPRVLQIKSLPLALLAALFPLTAASQLVCSTNNGGITITGYNGSETSITIPSATNGLPVTAIGSRAFYFQPQLQSITIPDSVQTIGSSAFIYCSGLTNVSLPNQLTNIDGAAFAFSGVQNIVIPDRVVNLGGDAFEYCSSLTNVVLGNGLTAIQYWTFYASGLTSIVIPDGILQIDDSAFGVCENLATVLIGGSVTNIGDSAFLSCSKLTNIQGGRLVASIGNLSFSGCAMSSFTISSNVTAIAPEAFGSCSHLTAFVVDPANPCFESPGGVLFDKTGKNLLEYPAGLSGSYLIPVGVTNIQSYAFEAASSLTSVTIPATVGTIGDYAFYFCQNLAGIYFEGAPPVLGGNYCFYDYTATAYYLPGLAGWTSSFGYLPAQSWLPVVQTADGRFGVQSNQFGFSINWARGQTLVVEANTNLGGTNWQPVATNTLGPASVYFADPHWTNYPARFYRVRPQ